MIPSLLNVRVGTDAAASVLGVSLAQVIIGTGLWRGCAHRIPAQAVVAGLWHCPCSPCPGGKGLLPPLAPVAVPQPEVPGLVPAVLKGLWDPRLIFTAMRSPPSFSGLHS